MVFFRIYLVLGFLALLGTRSMIMAQDFSSVRGRVTDATLQQPIAGVMVMLSPDGQIVFTDSDGRYEFRRVVPGDLSLRFRSAFHEERQLGPFLSREGEERTIDVSLQPVEIRAPGQQVTAEREHEAGVTRYNSKDIEEAKVSSVGEFLRQNGYQIVSDGRASHVSLRGFAPQSVLVLIDGQPINPDGSAVDLSSIPTSSIKCVEVYTSGAASLYGANALGGAINISSKDPSDQNQDHVSLSGAAGSFGLKSGDFMLRLPDGQPVDLLLNYEYSERRNDYPYEHPYLGEQRRQNNFERFYSLSILANYESIRGLSFSGRRLNSHVGIPGAVFQETSGAPLGKRQNQLYMLNYSRKSIECSAQFREIAQAFHDDQAFIPYSRNFLQIGRQLNLRWHPPLSGFCTMSLGAELLSENFFNDDYLTPARSRPQIRRRAESVFISTKIFGSWRRIRATAENRYRIDWIEHARHKSPHLGATLDFYSVFEIGAEVAYGESYRNPPLDALFWSNDVFVIANPDLKPENAITREAGFHLQADRVISLRARIIWFENDLHNLIAWRRLFDGKYQPVNIDRSEYTGCDLGLSVLTKDERFSVGYNRSALSATNRSERSGYYGKVVPFRPDRTEHFHLALRCWKLQLQYVYSFTGTRFIREANTKSQSPYQLHDLIVRTDFALAGFDYSLQAAVYNLTDKRYELLERMPMPSRTVALRLTLKI